MDDILDLIKSRRTITHFSAKYVSWENVVRVIEAGSYAPSSGNLQNWKFLTIQDPGKKKMIAKAAYDQYEITAASCLIVVCSETDKVVRYYGVRGERLFSVQNCAAAIQNMLLEAHSLGLGTRWIGAFDEDMVKDLLGIPPEVRPQAIIALGYVDEQPVAPPKYPLEHLIFLEKWGGSARDSAKYANNTGIIMARKGAALSKDLKKVVDAAVSRGKEALQKDQKEE